MIDEKRANAIKKFASQLCLTGEFAGEPFILHDFQSKIVTDILCTVTDDGQRQYKEAAIWMPKKNGKTTLISFIVLLALYSSSKGKTIVSAATTREQASLIYKDVEGMVRQNEFLRKRFKPIPTTKRIVDLTTGSYYESLSAEADHMDGKRFSLCIMDELHRWKNRDLYDTLRKSMANQSQPLLISISTAGDDRTSLGYDVWQYTLNVKNGIIKDPTFYPCVFAADENDKWDDEETWKKANPAYGLFLQADFLKKEAQRAKDSPSTKASFLRYHLNVWTDSADGFFDMAKVESCFSDSPRFNLKDAKLILGVDLSRAKDLTAVMELYKHGNLYYVKTNSFVPKDNIKEWEERDKVPYRQWVQQGYLTATPGDYIDHFTVLERIKEIAKEHPIEGIMLDPAGGAMFATSLIEAGFSVEFAASYAASMNKPTRELENLVVKGDIAFKRNDVLRWNMSNVVIESDNQDRIRPSKKKSKNKIDCAVSIIYALNKAMSLDAQPVNTQKSVYESRGLFAL